MAFIAEKVAARYMARVVNADMRFAPPREIVNGVELGELPVEVLAVWKACVESNTKAGRQLPEYGIRKYWVAKCLKNGIALPMKYQKGGLGATHGHWKNKSLDQIEEFCKQSLISKGLLDETRRTAFDVQMEITHFERMLGEAKQKIEGRLRGSGKGARTPLEQSQAEVEKFEKIIAERKQEIVRFQEEAARYAKAKSDAIAFEKDFQHLLQEAARTLGDKKVFELAQKALQNFTENVELEGPEIVQDLGWDRQAGVLDTLGGLLKKAWDWVTSALQSVVNWFEDLAHDTDQIASMMDEAGA